MSRLLEQCRNPTGRFGRLLAWGMNIGHSGLTAWGLGHISIEKHYSILDVGCGGGGTVRRLALIAAEGRIYGIDSSEESVAVSRRTNRKSIKTGRVEIRLGSVSCLPFADGMFDLAAAVETHYFWPDLVSDMREVLRVLRPEGKLVIMGEAYKGEKYDSRNRKLVALGRMAYLSGDELGQLFFTAGYSDVQVLEEYDRGWIYAMGKKPA